MAPMQWRVATVGGEDTTGFEAFGSQIRQESDVRQVQVGNIGQTGRGKCGRVSSWRQGRKINPMVAGQKKWLAPHFR